MPVRVTRVYTNLVGSWNDVTEEKSTVIAHSNLNNILVYRKLWIAKEIYLELNELNEDGTVCTKVHVYTDAAWETIQREVDRSGPVNDYVRVVESEPEFLEYHHYLSEPDWDEEELIGTMESLEQERLEIERNKK
jgi:hypothetical protein|tara:strand:- start:376 stop:780 length:405 start_codon:yes stop_codon:yes gene_type:complete